MEGLREGLFFFGLNELWLFSCDTWWIDLIHKYEGEGD